MHLRSLALLLLILGASTALSVYIGMTKYEQVTPDRAVQPREPTTEPLIQSTKPLAPLSQSTNDNPSLSKLKSADEIALLNRAAAMVDGAYDVVNEMLRPGVRENDIVAEVNKFLYTHGSDDVEAVNAISGERCTPHPHNFTDRMIRPGDQAFFDILQSFMGYRTCYYRTFNVVRATPAQHDAYKKAREWLDNAIARIKPGASTAHICDVFPKANEFGFPDEMSAFGLQFAHGLGLNLHERPIISRVVSMDHPTEIKEGMVFAIETYCPATDGFSAARIEEEVVVTDKGCRLISLFPAEELPISAKY